VRPDTQIPFMAMPDGIGALLALARAPKASLTRTAYNLAAFNPTAEEIRDEVVRAFPTAEITWNNDVKRQGIVDSWPADVDDTAARRDWCFAPKYDFERAFRDYLIPTIGSRYGK
jgi:threonine 3-dehydrogenase